MPKTYNLDTLVALFKKRFKSKGLADLTDQMLRRLACVTLGSAAGSKLNEEEDRQEASENLGAAIATFLPHLGLTVADVSTKHLLEKVQQMLADGASPHSLRQRRATDQVPVAAPASVDRRRQFLTMLVEVLSCDPAPRAEEGSLKREGDSQKRISEDRAFPYVELICEDVSGNARGVETLRKAVQRFRGEVKTHRGVLKNDKAAVSPAFLEVIDAQAQYYSQIGLSITLPVVP